MTHPYKPTGEAISMDMLINSVILETGFNETEVRAIVAAFLERARSASINDRVQLTGLGTLYTRRLKRRQWSFHARKVVETDGVQVTLMPSNSYKRLILKGRTE